VICAEFYRDPARNTALTQTGGAQMAKTQEDHEPIGRATDDEVSNTADAEFEDDELQDEDKDEDEKVDAEDGR
jgi:hypothetical protein